jgi:uncharacterized protein (TIGR02996 family)
VTTEDDFQAMLDANPDDHATRLIFADWLEERGDPRAEGYRALGRNRFRPVVPVFDQFWSLPGWQTAAQPLLRMNTIVVDFGTLPDDWLRAVPKLTDQEAGPQWRTRKSRREAEDAAALAFASLPAKRRAKLLAAQPAEGTAGS